MIGEYDQTDPAVLRYHILQAIVAGIDGFIVNVDPSSHEQKSIVAALFQQVGACLRDWGISNFTLTISYDGKTSDSSIVAEHFQGIQDEWLAPYSYLHARDAEGRIIFLCWSDAAAPIYKQLADTMFVGNTSVALLQRNAANFDAGDGNFEWVGTMSSEGTLHTNWGQQYMLDFEWIMGRQVEFGASEGKVNHLAMGCVYPGFNDSKVPVAWNGGTTRIISRKVHSGADDSAGGAEEADVAAKTMRSTLGLLWEWQLAYKPARSGGIDSVSMPWIQIATWNDWPEGTSIEPSMEFGFAALATTQHASARFHLKHDSASTRLAFPPAALQLPVRIYRLTMHGSEHEVSAAQASAAQASVALAQGRVTEALEILNLHGASEIGGDGGVAQSCSGVAYTAQVQSRCASISAECRAALMVAATPAERHDTLCNTDGGACDRVVSCVEEVLAEHGCADDVSLSAGALTFRQGCSSSGQVPTQCQAEIAAGLC
jgi:hypothetical protein